MYVCMYGDTQLVKALCAGSHAFRYTAGVWYCYEYVPTTVVLLLLRYYCVVNDDQRGGYASIL